MAEITTQSKPSKGKVRVKRMSTRIDMTPMVDLAFLLLTFFILTSSLQKSQIIDLQMPTPEAHEPQPINENNVLYLVLSEGNKVLWWIGSNKPAEITYASVRKILLEHRKNEKLMVLIKPKEKSLYQNMVDVLDEISITKTERYAIVDFTKEDEEFIASHLAELSSN